MSSFRRKTAPVAPAASAPASQDTADADTPPLAAEIVKPTALGLKPSVYNSLGLVSSGHTQLDELLGGGLQLGTAILIGSDLHSNYADTLLSYGLAEALSMRQPCLLLTADLRAQQELLASLPFNRTIGTAPPGSKSHFCCSYDLSRQLQPDILHWDGLVCAGEDLTKAAGMPCTAPEPLAVALEAYAAAVASFVRAQRGAVGRVFLYNLHDILYAHGHGHSAAALRCAMEKLIVRLRVIIRSSRMVLVISAVPEALPGSAGVATSLSSNSTDGGSSTASPMQPLVALVDTAFAIDTFAGRSSIVPYEFKEFCGFVVIERVQHLGTLVGHRPIALRFGLKRDRRKLHVERLHLPPEESRAQGAAGTDARLLERSHSKGQGIGYDVASGASAGSGGGTTAGISDIGNGAGSLSASGLSRAVSEAQASVTALTARPSSAVGTSTTPAEAALHGDLDWSGAAGTDSNSAASGSGRQYKRLNLGQSRLGSGGTAGGGAVGGGINISTFRKTAGAAAPAGPAGSSCGTTPGKDSLLEF